jgi:diadenosine tetraphosphate (Ap4A) HIT family hydrolase
VAEALGVTETGYRLVVNTGRDAKQTVLHTRLHLLAGATLNVDKAVVPFASRAPSSRVWPDT